ncbi:MAG: hypothetical protein IPJ42_05790 [Betaproteobacteria bacterium]|nr:hypothetical protein [Betaproteobacteria bacterium]
MGEPIIPPPPSSCLVDGRQLERFGETRCLPAGCGPLRRAPFLQRYAWQTAAVVLALLAQSALIAALLLPAAAGAVPPSRTCRPSVRNCCTPLGWRWPAG